MEEALDILYGAVICAEDTTQKGVSNQALFSTLIAEIASIPPAAVSAHQTAQRDP